MGERKTAERDFFNEAYALEQEQSLNGFYRLSAAVRHYGERVLRDCAGLHVLEYGCGTGGYAFAAAARGARVVGVDLSDVAVERARQRARQLAMDVTFRVADAEQLPFDSGSFDLVCGQSILHHLDIGRAVAEIHRVLRPAGRALFYEPVAYNPAAAIYRLLTPAIHTRDEHPLRVRDFHAIRARFPATRLDFYDLLSVAAIPFLRLPGGVVLLRGLEFADRLTLKMPLLRLLANVVVVELRS